MTSWWIQWWKTSFNMGAQKGQELKEKQRNFFKRKKEKKDE